MPMSMLMAAMLLATKAIVAIASILIPSPHQPHQCHRHGYNKPNQTVFAWIATILPMITVTNIHIRIINTIVTTRAVAVASGVLADLSPLVVAIARPLLQHMWRQAGHRDPEFCTLKSLRPLVQIGESIETFDFRGPE